MPATTEQKAKAAARRERFRAIVKQVGDMSEDKRAELAKSMGPLVTTEGHALSVHNSCLIAMQRPAATIVGGFRQWLKQNRCVAKGEHGISIWVPKARKRKDQETELGESEEKPGFIAGVVFDISQTIEIGSAE